MKLCTWNVNGIRAVKESLVSVIQKLDANLICFQETKITRDQLDEASAIVEGFNSYFSFSKVRSGYSGVATFAGTETAPFAAEEGLASALSTAIGSHGDYSCFSEEEAASLDNEGRTIVTLHKLRCPDDSEVKVALINVYCPRAGPDNEDRRSFKLRFCELLQRRAEAILHSGCHVIIVGDLNISHKEIDHCKQHRERDMYNGQQWLDDFLADRSTLADDTTLSQTPAPPTSGRGRHFVDMFRYFHPHQTEAYTNWCTVTGARATNYGTRIDYILADRWLAFNAFDDCIIMPEVEGSDHCPVKATLKWDCVPCDRVLPLCTKCYPEFTGRQQKLTSFFVKGVSQSDSLRQQVSVTQQLSSVNRVMNNDHPKTGREPVASNKGKAVKRVSGTATTNNKPPAKRGQVSLEHFVQRVAFTPAVDVHVSAASVVKQNSLSRSDSICGNNKTASTSTNQLESENVVSDSVTSQLSAGGSQSTTSDNAKNSLISSERSLLSNVPGDSCDSSECADIGGAGEPSVDVNCEATNTAVTWKGLLSGPGKPPLCKGHSEPCVLRTVKKPGPNRGKQFWTCAKPEGHKSNPLARCDYFVWVTRGKK